MVISTVKSGYIIKGPGTSFQPPALIPVSSIEHVRNVCHTALLFDQISF